MKIWFLTNTPSPYQLEFFRELSLRPGMELEVCFLFARHREQDEDVLRSLCFPWRVLYALRLSKGNEAMAFHPGIYSAVRASQADLFVLSGLYTSPTFHAASWILLHMKKPWLMWLERPWPEDYRPRWAGNAAARFAVAGRIRSWMLKRLLNQAHGLMGVGSVAVEYYSRLAPTTLPMLNQPYVCRLDRFCLNNRQVVSEFRQSHGVNGRTVFLFSGQMIYRKGVDLLLRVFRTMVGEGRDDVSLLLLGDGPMRRELEQETGKWSRGLVKFLGHRPQDELPLIYAGSDVFVFPSRYDGWGVVLNEACAAGLPVITTRRAGAARDLVKENENGFIVNEDDEGALLCAMKKLADSADLRAVYGERSRLLISNFSPARAAENLIGFADAVLKKSPIRNNI